MYCLFCSIYRTLLGDPAFFASLIGTSTELVQGFADLWLALRASLPRPLDPEKFYQFGQTVKALYKAEVSWMAEKCTNVTFHKIVDHPREILNQIPDTLRVAMLDEGPLEVCTNFDLSLSK